MLTSSSRVRDGELGAEGHVRGGHHRVGTSQIRIQRRLTTAGAATTANEPYREPRAIHILI